MFNSLASSGLVLALFKACSWVIMSTSKSGLWALLRKLDITLKRHQKI